MAATLVGLLVVVGLVVEVGVTVVVLVEVDDAIDAVFGLDMEAELAAAPARTVVVVTLLVRVLVLDPC